MDFIEASGLSFSQLNETIRHAGKECRICACQGQRFIAAGMSSKRLEIDGIPGNALGAYLGGGSITVNGNAQDAVGDTMSAGRIVIHGSTGSWAAAQPTPGRRKPASICGRTAVAVVWAPGCTTRWRTPPALRMYRCCTPASPHLFRTATPT